MPTAPPGITRPPDRSSLSRSLLRKDMEDDAASETARMQKFPSLGGRGNARQTADTGIGLIHWHDGLG